MRGVLVLCLVLVGCGNDKGDESGTTPVTGATSSGCGTLIGEGLPAALYSVWGTSASDVWMVGADDGTGPLVLHWDGAAWTRVQTGTTGDLWWVWGSSADDVWFSGEGGRVVHHVPSASSFDEAVVGSTTQTLFGIWGSGPSDIWTVGGNPSGTGEGAAIRYDGTSWTVQTDLPAQAVAGMVFKVWGSGADDVWMVGNGALIVHTNGAGTWEVVAPPAGMSPTSPLFTVSGCNDHVIAVGGYGNAAIASYDGSTWVLDSPPPMALAPGFNGVAADCVNGDVAVGNATALWRRGTEWAPICDPFDANRDFHGTWIDPDGGIWAVGGDLTNQVQGVVAYVGNGTVADISVR